ncbi:MAG: phytanoyl-CoA dioxygenase family protein [Blastocatellia bacterium]
MSLRSSVEVVVLPGGMESISPGEMERDTLTFRSWTGPGAHTQSSAVRTEEPAASFLFDQGVRESAFVPADLPYSEMEILSIPGPVRTTSVPDSKKDDSDRLFNSRVSDPSAKRGRTWVIEQSQLPWYDQPNALELLDRRRTEEQLSDDDYKMLHQWATDGYCIVSGVIPEKQIDSMMRDFDDLWTASRPFDGLQFFDLRLGPNGSLVTLTHAELLKVDLTRRLKARDSSNWRINHFDAYSEGARAIFYNPELIRLTALIFGRRSVPEATLNFMYGSAQDAHQDTAVFHIFPPNYIIGAWIACEDISPDSGPLMFYPKSHLEPIFEKFDNYPQTNLRTADPVLFKAYHDYVEELTDKYGQDLFIAKKGEILLWHGMLLHGGSEIKDPRKTRKSYVIHYTPPGMNVGNDIEGPFNW